MDSLLVAQVESISAENTTLAPAASPALAAVPPATVDTVVSGSALNGTVTPTANATSVPGLAPETMISWGGYFEALAWLCFALALLWLVLWLLKRRGMGLSGGSISGMYIESRLALGPKKWIIIARYMDRRLILGVTELQISLLSEMPVDDEGREGASRVDKSFAAFLKKQGPGQAPGSGE